MLGSINYSSIQAMKLNPYLVGSEDGNGAFYPSLASVMISVDQS